MVEHIFKVVGQYEQRLRQMQKVPKFSYGRGLLCADGAPNRIFLTCLFTDMALAIEFMKDLGFIRRKVECDICGRDMTSSADPTRSELFTWLCRKGSRAAMCVGRRPPTTPRDAA